MNQFIIYNIQSAISLCLLYAVYFFFLKKETFYSLNRFYLTGSLLFSLLIPAVDLSVFFPASGATFNILLDEITITPDGVERIRNSNTDLFGIFVIAYFSGMALFLLRFFYQVFQLYFFTRKYGIVEKDNVKLIYIDKKASAFSFFNLIFLNNKRIEKNDLQNIIMHEKVHVQQGHSLDLIILEMVTFLQWFNPVVWMYRHSVKELHEYIADQGVLQSGSDRVMYQKLMLSMAMGATINDLAHHFNYSLTKRRFIMMNKKRSNRPARLKLLLAAPVAMTIVIFACQDEWKTKQEIRESRTSLGEEQKDEFNQQIASKDEKIYSFEELKIKPDFQDGQEGMLKFFQKNFSYPKEAKEKGISGKVFVSFTIDKTGQVTNVKIKEGVHKLLDDEAIRFVSAMPAWKPGINDDGVPVKVQFILPVNFKLQ